MSELLPDGVRPDELPYEDAPPEIVAALNRQTPTVQQWEAISHPLEPGAIIAGAGSGKTAVMAARVVYLALVHEGRIPADHGGAPPSQVLALTFTNKAAEELSRRVLTAVSGLGLPEGEEPTVLTYHAFAARLLADYGLRMGREVSSAVMSEAHRWQLMGSLLDELDFDAYEIRSDYVVGEVLPFADQVANHLADPDEIVKLSLDLAAEIQPKNNADRDTVRALRKRADLARMVKAYQQKKETLGLVDYGDQIALAVRLVEEHPEVGEQFRARYPVVLLDEYQDTNVAQARLLRGLVGPDYPILAVGDPDQNIYAWRGASLKNILRFGDDFAEGEAAERPLYVNFRSGSRILQVANTVIDEVPPERRAVGKELRPHPSKGEGRVVAFVAEHAVAEAEKIADLVSGELERRGRTPDGRPAYEDIAILCRKKKLFGPIADALRERGIPVEVVDLGGLLQLPEIVDVVAWLRLLDDPTRNVHLARILMGPRWRIGYRDLAVLARWSMRNNAEFRHQLPDPEDLPGDVAFALAESLDRLDDPEMSELSPEARERLLEFRALLSDLRESAKGPLADLVGEIVERSGVLAELEASRDPAAVGRRRNLLNLIQHVSSFSPVSGEASLSTLIEYLDTAEDKEDDLEQAQPSEANTVKMLTIHKAKGLEWPVVFVPGMSEHRRSNASIFPDVSRQPNPITQASTLPFELRGDADVLPSYDGNIKEFRRVLTERGLEEERRLCYVALTRAQELLVVSASFWYEGPQDPHEPGQFFAEVAKHEACELTGGASAPEEDPFIALRQERAAGWPPPARWDEPDELFPEGWREAAVRAAADPSDADRRAAELPPPEQTRYRELVEAAQERLALIDERTAPDRSPAIPSQLSVSSVIDYTRCPKLFYWSHVRPLPRRSSRAARVGTQVHRWIELQGRGQATLLDVDELPDLATEERLGEPGDIARLRRAFKESRFADRVPLYAERPFVLYLDGFVVGGRIDAIFEREDGGWEIVDYKTGRRPAEDAVTGFQLDLYALAAAEVWRKRPEELS
ncbi:MAG TPA: ATP-dependent DNA helicase, partial [Actinomycetota bacterium]|nr:ATP-dependent DNA helicase [Actinomycetota bacterium]